MEAPDLVDLFQEFKRHNQGKSARTVQAYGDALRRLEVFLDGRGLAAATEDDLVMFCGPWLHKQGVQALGRRPYIAAVREFYRWARHARKVDSNVAASLTYPRHGRKLPKMISLQHAEALMWAPDFGTFDGIRDAAIIGVLLGCGLRVSGLVRLNQGNLVQIEHQGEPRMSLRVLEKGEKERMLPVPRETEMLLRVYLEHPTLRSLDRALPDGDQVLFVSRQNQLCPPHEYHGERRRIGVTAVRRMLKKHGQRVGIPVDELHPHALRHLYGTELAEANIDLIMRQELLGHADPKHTRIYDHMAMRRKVEAADRGTPLARMRTPVSHLLQQLAKDRTA